MSGPTRAGLCRFLIGAGAAILLGCGGPAAVHKDFVANLIKDSTAPRDTRSQHISRFQYSDASKVLLVGRESGTVDIWDSTQPLSKRTISAHGGRVIHLTFTPGGEHFFSNSFGDQETKLWETRSGKLLQAIPETSGPLTIAPDGRHYVIAKHGELRVLDFSKKTLLSQRVQTGGVVTAITADKAAGRIAVGTGSGTIEIRSFAIEEGRAVLKLESNASPYAMGEWVVRVFFSDKGRTLYTVSRGGSIDEWTVAPLQKNRTLSTALKHIHDSALLPERGLLALSGTVDERGFGAGQVELLTLSSGRVQSYPTATNLATVGFVSSLSLLMVPRHPAITSVSLAAPK
jgi:WD40 repeat protein